MLNRPPLSRTARTLFALFTVFLLPMLDTAGVRADTTTLEVVDYEYAGARRVSRTDYEFTYRITVRNGGDALANVVATAASSAPFTTIVDATVDVGDVAAGATVLTTDTFTFRQNRRYRFNPDSIVWSFAADPAGPTNTPPVADAGPDQSTTTNTVVTLNASGSTDADGDALSYLWTFLQVPAASNAVLDDPAAVMPEFLADRPGDYVAQLVVNDGKDQSAPDTVTVSTSNTRPVADAGLDQTVTVGTRVVIFGDASEDANGDVLTYAWRLADRPVGSEATLESTSGIDTAFTVDAAGEYVVELIVNDGYVDSLPDSMTVTTANSPPVADAGDDQSVVAGETVVLDGSFSFDVDDDALTYLWSLLEQPDSSSAAILDSGAATTSFLADQDGLYVAQLIVDDGTTASDPDTAVIEARSPNEVPVAVATATPAAPEPGALVELDGSASSDPEGADLSYSWTLAVPAGSNASLTSATDVATSFVADVEGSYTATLVVDDGELASAPATVTVPVAVSNNPPTLASIGNRVMFLGESLAFRIFGIDPDAGDTLRYSLPAGPDGIGIDPVSGQLNFTPDATQLGANAVTARVEDQGGLSDTRTFTIEVRSLPAQLPDNGAPVLDPIAGRNVPVGTALTIQAVASDPDDDPLTWTLPAAPAGMTIDADGSITWLPGAADARAHDVTVQVTDPAGAAALQSFMVTVSPLNRAPVAVDDLYQARIGETISETVPGVLQNDSDADADPLSAQLVATTTKGVLDFRADGSFDYTPGLPEPIGPVELELLCESPISANDFQHNGTVAVGDVDNDGQAEIVGYNWITNPGRAELWILNAADCTPELATSPAVVAAGGFAQGSHPGLLDIDGDGDLEIIAPREALPQSQVFDSRHLLAVHHDGTPAWPGDGGSATSPTLGLPAAGSSSGAYRYTGPTFADIDADGVVEIVMPWHIIGSVSVYLRSGITVYDSRDGSIKWEYTGPDQRADADYKPPVVADLDRDGTMEIILHTQVVDHTGGLEFELPVESYLGGPSRITTHLYSAVADFDGDTFAEIVAYDQQNVYLFEENGALAWQRPFVNNGQSQVTVADLDADGEVEFAFIAGTGNLPGYMVAFDTDGQVLWSHAGNPELSPPFINRSTGPNITAWDANADGAADLVVHYDNGISAQTGVYIFDGRDGSVLEFVAIDSYFTEQRFMTVADVDDDGTAELISSFTSGGTGATRVWRGTTANPLPAAPGVRNQWMFDQTRIDDAANVLTDPEPAWLQPGRNGFHLVSDPHRVYTQTQCELPFNGPRPTMTNGTVAVGDVDNDGDIELVGMSWITNTFTGEFFILNAEDCSVQLPASPLVQVAAVGGVRVGSHLGLLDIDGDGDLELIAHRLREPNGGFDPTPSLVAAHHDGTLAWPGNGGSEPTGRTYIGYSEPNSGPTFADLDDDGTVEILVPWNAGGCGASVSCSGVTVYNSADGSLKWEYQAEPKRDGVNNQPIAVVDLDLDGTMEVIVHNHVVSHDGEFEFRLPIRDAFSTTPGQGLYLHTAVANFDDDPYPEIVGRSRDWTYLFEHDGTLAWEIARETPSTSAISVADFDGDGQVEFGWMDGDYSVFSSGLPRYLAVFDTDGTPLWSHANRDRFQEPSGFAGGARQGVTAFDANADGAYDLVVHLNAENGNGLYIFSGRDGSLLEFMPVDRYAPFHRFPTIADVDGDGEAEIVTSFNTGLRGTVRVIGGTEAKPLPPAPQVRTQWIFHEGYADADGDVLSNPTPHWLRPELNGWNLIKRAPDPLAGTTDAFTYQVSDGQRTSNIATVTFDVQPAGTPPAFLSEPDTLTTVGFPYEYAARVVDLDAGDTVSLSLAAAPAGMTLSSTGRLNWTPDAVGEYAVSLIASDTIGFSTVQSYTLVVGEPVVVPDVVGQSEAAAGTSLTGANLVVGSSVAVTHPSVPAGSVSSQAPPAGSVAEFGAQVDLVVSTGPAPSDIDDDGDGFTENQGDCDDGDAAVAPGAADEPADGIDANCDGIDGDLALASIVISPAGATVLTGQSVPLSATGIFADGTSQNLTGVVGWSAGPLFSSADPGSFIVTATRGAVSGSATVKVVARATGDTVPPTASLTSPAANATVTEPVEVLGSAADGNFLKYELAYAPAGETDFTTIVTSTAPVTNGPLGRFDPTLLINDLYTLRLTVSDTGGNQYVDEATVQVDGGLKVGNFTLSFTDLEIPLAGIPITVTRTYDSRDKAQGDFGIGWRLDVNTLQLRTNRVPGTGWRVDRSGLAFGLIPTDQHKVSLTLPNGRVEEFDLVVSPRLSPLVPFPASSLRASFAARPGTLGRLESLANNTLTIFDPQPGSVILADDVTGDTYDPELFRYTAPDGTRIVISRLTGVRSITDPSGNVITFTPDGITHSSGRSVAFRRDGEGRIISVTDPAGNEQVYSYDSNGDLVSHVDAEGHRTRYAYDRNHGLIRVTDPLERVIARTEYDQDGRLISVTNAAGRTIEYARDLDARQEVVTDAAGNVTVLEYDRQGNVLRVTDPLGGVTVNSYDADGNQTSTTNPLGETTTRSFDSRGNLLTETNPAGETSTYSYDQRDRLTSTTDPLGRTTRYEYDAAGRLTRTVNALGIAEEIRTYDSNGNVIVRTDANGNPTRFEYDAFGNRIAEIDGRGNRSTTSYDPTGAIVSETDARGTTVSTTVDGRGLFTSKTDPLGQTSTFTFDPTGALTTAADPFGNSSALALDANGKDISYTDALGQSVTRAYDAQGNLVALTNANGETTRYEYDPLGRRTRTISPDGGEVVLTYDLADRILTETDALGNVTSFEYDAAGRNTRRTDALGNSTTFAYDAAGNLVSQTDAKGNTFEFEYDALDRLIRSTYPDGVSETKTYDGLGNLLSETDALGRTTSYTYDRDGNLVAVDEPGGATTRFEYDAEDNLVRQIDALGRATLFAYDANGRRTSKTFPDGTVESQTYDAAGRIATTTDPNGDVTTLEYDAGGQLIGKLFADGSEESYTYSPSGQLLSATNGQGVTAYEYDSMDRPTRITQPDGSYVAFSYDRNGNRIRLVTGIGIRIPRVTTYTYDALNRISSVTDPDDATTSYTYDAIGNVSSITYPNGVLSSFTYDSRSRLVNLRHTRGLVLIADYDYEVNAAGDRTRVVHPDGSWVDYAYDSQRRLSRESHYSAVGTKLYEQSYTYDLVGNRLNRANLSGQSVSYTYTSADQLIAAGDSSFGYDANGNRLLRSDPTGVATYEFDPENQLRTVTTATGSVHYSYDAVGERLSRSAGGLTTNFLVDPINPTGVSQVLADYGESYEQFAEYTWGSELIGQDRGGVDHYHHRDGSLNVRALTDAGGQLTDTYDYNAFGELLGRSGDTPNSYRFASERFGDPEGLTYLRARYYDPASGRFLSRDPFEGILRDPVSLHRYLYANSNPISNSDPTGQFTLSSELKVALTIAVTTSVAFDLASGVRNPTKIVANATVSAVFAAVGGAASARLTAKLSQKVVSTLTSQLARKGMVFISIATSKAMVSTLLSVVEGATTDAIGSTSGSVSRANIFKVFVINLGVEVITLGIAPVSFNANDVTKTAAASAVLQDSNNFRGLRAFQRYLASGGDDLIAFLQRSGKGKSANNVANVTLEAIADGANVVLRQTFLTKGIFRYESQVREFLNALNPLVQKLATI